MLFDRYRPTYYIYPFRPVSRHRRSLPATRDERLALNFFRRVCRVALSSLIDTPVDDSANRTNAPLPPPS